MNRVPYNVEKSGFQKNFEKKIDLENFRSESFSDCLISPAVAGLFY